MNSPVRSDGTWRGRILQVLPDGAIGGGPTHVLRILTGLGSLYQFGLVTSPSSYMAAQAAKLGISTTEIDFFSGPVRAFFQLRKVIKDFLPDVVHAHGSRGALWSALCAPKIPRIYTVHGYHFLHRSPLARWVGTQLDRGVSSRGAALVFVSDYDSELARGLGILQPETKARTIHNGIEIPDALPERRSQGRRLGFIGRLVEQKDPVLFVSILATLPDHTAVVVGEGELEGRVRREIQRFGLTNIQMLGPKGPEEVAQVLKDLDILVMTSRWEGLPYLLLEAVREGVPVVASRVGGVPEVVGGGQGGLLVDSRDPAEFAQAIRRLTGDPKFSRQLVELGMQHLRSSFSLTTSLQRLAELYQEMIAESNRSGPTHA